MFYFCVPMSVTKYTIEMLFVMTYEIRIINLTSINCVFIRNLTFYSWKVYLLFMFVILSSFTNIIYKYILYIYIIL